MGHGKAASGAGRGASRVSDNGVERSICGCRAAVSTLAWLRR